MLTVTAPPFVRHLLYADIYFTLNNLYTLLQPETEINVMNVQRINPKTPELVLPKSHN